MSNVVDPVNIGNPAELSVMDFALTIKRLLASKSRIIHKPLPVDDPKVRRPDITRAKKLLNWGPKVSLEEGLSKTIKWFQSIKRKG
jgi:dTDP-glucose 4,6-dehydratase